MGTVSRIPASFSPPAQFFPGKRAQLQDTSPHSDLDRDETGFLRRQFDRIRPAAIGAWLGDLGRFWWALAALNLSKTIYVIRKRRTRCPCQNPSDSGRAWETGCDAAAYWNDPARFRRVCPLLMKAPDGRWRCSVDAARVRPFWLRAAAWTGGTAAALYVGCVLLAFAFLQAVGYPVRISSVAWPPAWHQIRESRAVYFFQRAEAALRANRTGEALLYLAQSYQLDPHAYMPGRILAQLWQTSENDVSNQIYRRLMDEHPAQRAETAQAWYLSLLARGDFKSIEVLAWERINAEKAEAGVWLNALLVASRRTHDTRFLEEASKASALPEFARQACAWELMTRGKSKVEAWRVLTAPPQADEAPFLLYYRIDWLIEAGYAGDALFQLNREQARLPAADRCWLLLDAYAALGWQSILQDQVGRLLAAGQTGTPLLELLCAHLIRYPNGPVLAQVADAFDKSPAGQADQGIGAYLSLYCAAGASGDWKRLQAAGTAMKSISGGKIVALDVLEHYFRTSGRSAPIERYLPVLPSMPVDIVYALYTYSDSHPPGILSDLKDGRRAP
jgi:hypothetical protein